MTSLPPAWGTAMPPKPKTASAPVMPQKPTTLAPMLPGEKPTDYFKRIGKIPPDKPANKYVLGPTAPKPPPKQPSTAPLPVPVAVLPSLPKRSKGLPSIRPGVNAPLVALPGLSASAPAPVPTPAKPSSAKPVPAPAPALTNASSSKHASAKKPGAPKPSAPAPTRSSTHKSSISISKAPTSSIVVAPPDLVKNGDVMICYEVSHYSICDHPIQGKTSLHASARHLKHLGADKPCDKQCSIDRSRRAVSDARCDYCKSRMECLTAKQVYSCGHVADTFCSPGAQHLFNKPRGWGCDDSCPRAEIEQCIGSGCPKCLFMWCCMTVEQHSCGHLGKTLSNRHVSTRHIRTLGSDSKPCNELCTFRKQLLLVDEVCEKCQALVKPPEPKPEPKPESEKSETKPRRKRRRSPPWEWWTPEDDEIEYDFPEWWEPQPGQTPSNTPWW
ncbi:hypothetical protein F5Y16DRAFT_322958 [Xylariaceae sp. FL0255]|nr:hypothetical protein F5Y16DRAFT_322958 [Xylariaceae sp. FL0255]